MRIDKGFRPLASQLEEFEREVGANGARLTLCVVRNRGYNFSYSLNIFKDGENDKRNLLFAERLLKTMLWLVGGYKVYVCGSRAVYEGLQRQYAQGGAREFDCAFMSRVYEQPFELIYAADPQELPAPKACTDRVGGHLDGCRIGFDAGGSDRKVSAVVDGKTIFSQEVVWFPKINSDPEYHKQGILSAFRAAAEKLPRVDAIGVSTAGVCVDNKIMVASLFLAVNEADFEAKVKNIYADCARELGADIPLTVANDGDVSALAGVMDTHEGRLLGIAMGTSEAAGYIDADGCMRQYLSELAFVPIDVSEEAAVDEWSGDCGCGVKYLSQDAVAKLYELAGQSFPDGLTPAEKLKHVQQLTERGDTVAENVFRDIGSYFAHAIALYSRFYDVATVMLLGRVASGKGGELLVEETLAELATCYPELKIKVLIPDEKSRRVGQAIAAASLPEIR